MPDPIPMEKVRAALHELQGEFDEAIHPFALITKPGTR
jgi:hypothetical protein